MRAGGRAGPTGQRSPPLTALPTYFLDRVWTLMPLKQICMNYIPLSFSPFKAVTVTDTAQGCSEIHALSLTCLLGVFKDTRPVLVSVHPIR